MLRLAAAPEGLDDHHAPTAAGARTRQHARFVELCGCGRIGLFGAGRRGEQFARPCDVGGAVATGQQPVVTDAGDAAPTRQRLRAAVIDPTEWINRKPIRAAKTNHAAWVPREAG